MVDRVQTICTPRYSWRETIFIFVFYYVNGTFRQMITDDFDFFTCMVVLVKIRVDRRVILHMYFIDIFTNIMTLSKFYRHIGL